MLNSIPVIGWFFSLMVAVGVSVPFWICWTVCGLGKYYFYFVPERYQVIPFWDCVGLFIIIGILGYVVKLLSPTIVTQSNTNNNDEKEKDESFTGQLKAALRR